jgi:hypothetical protein
VEEARIQQALEEKKREESELQQQYDKKSRGRKRPRNRNNYEEEEVSFIVEHWRKIVCVGVLALALAYIMHSSRAS